MDLKQIANEVNTKWFFYMDIEEDEDDIIVYFLKADKWFNSAKNEKKIVKPTQLDILGMKIIAPMPLFELHKEPVDGFHFPGTVTFSDHAHIITRKSKEEIVEICMDWGFLNLNAISELDPFDQREMNLEYSTRVLISEEDI